VATAVWVVIIVPMRTRRNVLLSTLDVRQIQGRVLGRWKAPGMESNPEILHN
jgi:hypothetical protein